MAKLLHKLNCEIWNCENAFQDPCPMFWSQLARTKDQGSRHCNICDQDVHLCKTPEDFVKLGNAGQCVAILDRLVPGQLNMGVLGRPSPESVRKLEQRNKDCREWWNAVINQNVHFAPDAIAAVRRTMEFRNG